MAQPTHRMAVTRTLLVAFSVVCGGLCLATIFFWFRSYTYADSGMLRILPTEYVQFHAGDGRMCVWFEHKPIEKWAAWWSHPITTHTPPDAENRIPWFNLAFWPTFARLYLAHWVLVVVTGALAVLPWCPRRFTLRGMLVAVTIVGTVTATISWVDQTF